MTGFAFIRKADIQYLGKRVTPEEFGQPFHGQMRHGGPRRLQGQPAYSPPK
jgi:hypothetical protein